MEDHDTGASAPEVGVSRASPTPPGQAGPSAGRHHDRHAEPRSGNGQAGDAQHQKGKSRKRRKRRRGRKVFVRDDNHAVVAVPSTPA
ncbi:MAG: Ppx/GppA family phosphatase, partial [Mesorhizobium sp.]